jgi:hypothetical protein
VPLREDERESVHSGVEHGCDEKVGAGAIVEPGDDDGDGNQEDYAHEKVVHECEKRRAVEIERGAPESPREPNQESCDERRETLFELREEKASPAGFFEGSRKEEIVGERDSCVGGELEGVARLRASQKKDAAPCQCQLLGWVTERRSSRTPVSWVKAQERI